MIKGENWVIEHLLLNKGMGNTKHGREWVARVRMETPHVSFICDQCGSYEMLDVATDLKRTRSAFKRIQRNRERFDHDKCPECMRIHSRKAARQTRATAEWKTRMSAKPSWQSTATLEQLQDWKDKGAAKRRSTFAAMSPEQRSQGVRKQWVTMSPEAKDARAQKIGKASVALWASYTPEERSTRVRNMIKGLPRSAVSNRFQQALYKAGLYDGFRSEVVISGFVVDECHSERKLIIEFNGDYFHCNPRIFTDPNMINTTLKMTAQEKWKYDRRRLAALRLAGYRTLVVWEGDWNTNPEKSISTVRHFLESS